ncbi:MAG: 2-oxoacid:acceptor oxidoreductase family protein [Proteobacteria bacterium]|nr:2-oxoacid:acceptor oxidoreductase family protein [Pseudomonadota bacterium]
MTVFLDQYRKAQTPEQTHFCPGCGHGNLLRYVDEALCALGCEARAIWVSPVGCGGLTDAYLSVSHILSAHGRASAVGTAVKRLHPDAVVIVSQGDGDLASIGFLEALHAANRGECLTVFFVNNANFAMTGGQMAPTTLLGQVSATTPGGRQFSEHGAPLKVCELFNQLEGPAFIARVAIGSERQIAEARRVIHRAVRNQVESRGYSFVEILSPCPSNWHCTPAEARDRVAEVMTQTYPLGIFRDADRSDMISARQRVTPYDPARVRAPFEALARPVTVQDPAPVRLNRPMSVCCAGFGGQGVLTLGRLIARIGLASGLNATWIPSYGPEMRGGSANCFVRLQESPVSTPIVDCPDVVIAMNQPALDRFASRAAADGVILYDSDVAAVTGDISARCVGIPATSCAAAAGLAQAANLVMLRAFLEHADITIDWDAVIGCLPERFGAEMSRLA